MQYPIGSMYAVFTYIYYKDHLNVGKYTIHGSYGRMFLFKNAPGCKFLGNPSEKWPFPPRDLQITWAAMRSSGPTETPRGRFFREGVSPALLGAKHQPRKNKNCCFRYIFMSWPHPWNTTDIKEHKQQLECSHESVVCFFFWDVTFKERESAFATSFVWDELNKNLILCPGKPGRFPCWDVFWIFCCFFSQNCDTLGVFPEFFPVGSMGAAILYLPTFYIPIKNITYTLYLKIYGHRFFWESVTGFLSGRSRQDVYLHLPTWTP